jgi:hypothetical protein
MYVGVLKVVRQRTLRTVSSGIRTACLAAPETACSSCCSLLFADNDEKIFPPVFVTVLVLLLILILSWRKWTWSQRRRLTPPLGT